METHKGQSVPIVREFQVGSTWSPVTPVKPNLARLNPGPIYGNSHGGLLTQVLGAPDHLRNPQDFRSKYTDQHLAQNLLSYSISPADYCYPTTSNHILGETHGAPSLSGRIHLPRESDNIVQRRGLEADLPHSTNKGRRSVATNVGTIHSISSKYPSFTSWEPSRLPRIDTRVDVASILQSDLEAGPMGDCSFRDILNMGDTPRLEDNGGNASTYGMSGMSVTEWLSQNQVSRMASGVTFSNQDNLGLYHQNGAVSHQEEQNGALNQIYWRDGNAYSPLTAKYVGGRCSTFAPPTPDSMQRIESSTATWKLAPGTNGDPEEQNELPEHEVAAAMINLHSHHDMQAPGPTTDSTQGENSKEMEVIHNPENDGDNGFDLNKTPQKKNKKRRYKPKVITENKPKRTLKPKTPKPTEPEDAKGKRKYVRKNKIKTPSTSSPGEASEINEPKPAEPAAKSCRKSLNFDLNGQLAEDNSFHMTNGGLDVEPQANGSPNSGDELRQPEHLSHVEEPHMKVSVLETAYDLNCNEHQQLRDYMSLPQNENLESSLSDMNFLPWHKESTSSLYKHKADISCRRDSFCTQSPYYSMQARGSKRSYSYIADTTDATAATVDAKQSIICQHASTEKLPYGFIPEACKKKRTEKVQRPHTTSTSSPAAASKDLSRIASNPHHLGVNLNGSKYLQCNLSLFKASAVTNQAKVSFGSSATEQLANSWAALDRLKKKRSNRARNLAAQAGSCSQMIDTKNEPYSCTKKTIGVQSCTEALALDTKATPRSKRTSIKQDAARKNLELVVYGSNQSTRKAAGSTSARRPVTVDKITQLLKRLDINAKDIKGHRYRKNSKIPSGEQNAIVPYNIKKHKYNALVPYERDGTIVRFDGAFNPIRKRRQRAKVDLDDETTRVWRLLLENIDNQGVDGTDEDKAKWWENERGVFRGRVDSFIARMSLVQGDRRFTRWKGSVLDSVIGVFLTQNVSDHLSSSAFMSMASRFPFKTQSNRSSLSEESSSALAVEPDMYVIEPEESITWNEKTAVQPALDLNSTLTQYTDHSEEKEVVSSKELIQKPSPASPAECFTETCGKISNESRAANSQTTKTDTGSIIGNDKARDDATLPQQSDISSQNSINSPNLWAASMMNTLNESTSRAQAASSHCSFSFMEMLRAAEKPLLNESYSQMHHQLESIRHVTEFFPEMTGFHSSNYQFSLKSGFHLQDTKGIEMLELESRSSDMSRKDENSPATEQSNLTTETADQQKSPDSISGAPPNMCSYYVLEGDTMVMQSVEEPLDTIASSAHGETCPIRRGIHLSNSFQKTSGVTESTTIQGRKSNSKDVEHIPETNYATVGSETANGNPANSGKGRAGKKKKEFDWDSLRREARANGKKTEQTPNTRDSLDWEAVRRADVKEISDTIKERGMNNMLAERIKDLLDRLVRDHGSIDLEWLRDIPPDKAKEYLLSFRGLGLKSVECVRLLTLHHLAFPVDTNVGRIAVRLGWVPLQPLPESLQLHLLEMYPILESIQQYLWPRLCKLDQKTLYELHYHMITFGKVFCTKRQPNCNACPLRGECRHFASAFASARFSLPGPEERSIIPSIGSTPANVNSQASINLLPSPTSWSNHGPHSDSRLSDAPTMPVSYSPLQLQMSQTIYLERKSINSICEPIVECPASPEPETQQEQVLCDIEDSFYEDPNEIPTIQLNMKEFTQTLQNFMHANSELQEAGMSNELVALTPEAASIPMPKLKNINRLRTEHHVYELPDTHPLLQELERRERDDPSPYLLAIWTPGETANSVEPPARKCISDDPRIMCNEETCSYCSSLREASSQTVRGTILIPCRTAMRGSFPLNGTYFQVNEVFADHDSSLNPIAVPRSWLWNLPRRTVYFGTSIPSIFKGLNTEDIQHCFWRGYVCVRGFDKTKRAPRPLMARLHFPASRMARGAKGKVVYDE